MSESDSRRKHVGAAGVAAWAREIDFARARLHAARNPPCRSVDERMRQADLLAALEGFAAAIEDAGAPCRTDCDPR